MIQDYVKEILTKYKIVAVAGLSRDPSKDSYRVAEYLKAHGFDIIPVNPSANEILGEKAYKTLLDMPVELQKKVEIVDIFRPSQDVLPIVEDAIRMKEKYGTLKVIWMQLGIVNEKAAEKARNSGLTVVMDRCMMQEHSRLSGGYS